MARQRRHSDRLVASVAAAALIITGCGGATLPLASPSTPRRPSATHSDARPRSTAATIGDPSTGSFIPMVYPPGGPAPCDQAPADLPDGEPYVGTIRRISAKDPLTVTFELCGPDVAFLAKISSPSLAINDTAWLQSRIDPAAGSQRILSEVNGTGPFRLESWSVETSITLARFDRYWGDPARTGVVVFVTGADAGRRLADLREGSVDAIDFVATKDVQAATDNPELTLVPRAGLNVAYIGMNNRFAPYDSELVRQALASGIDRRSIVSQAFPPGAELATHFLPCAIEFGCDGPAWPEFDVAAAREVLAKAGYPGGFPTTISYSDEARNYLPDPGAVALALQIQLREDLGIEATLKVLPFEELTNQADAGRLDGLYLLGAQSPYPDASVMLDRYFGPASSAQFGERFEDIGRALDEARVSAKNAMRGEGYRRASELIRRHVPMVPLAHVGSDAAFRTDVLGAHASPTAADLFAMITPGDRNQFVYMQATQPVGLYCADETEAGTLRICAQVSEPLYRQDISRASVAPALARACVPTRDLTVWTCALRPGVLFHDGSSLDANDVVLSYAVQWDADHPLHRGREGTFGAFVDRFGGFLNSPTSRP